VVESHSEKEDEKYDAGKDFVDNMLVNDVASLGTKWFNLPDVSQLDAMIQSKFSINKNKVIKLEKEKHNKYFLEQVLVKVG
jgi:hypothetical protein